MFHENERHSNILDFLFVQGTNPASPTNVTNSSDIVVVPALVNTWTCINSTTSVSWGVSSRLYLRTGVTYVANVLGNITVFLESASNFTVNSVQDVTVYLQSRAIFTANGAGNIRAYLESRATCAINGCENITAYIKSNASITSASSSNITTYYENGARQSFQSFNGKTEIPRSSITFNYSSSLPISC